MPSAPAVRGQKAEAPATGKRCSQCSAPIEFDPESGGLKCGYCGAQKAITRAAVPPQPVDVAAASDRLPPGGTRSLKCTQCGARTTVPDTVAATVCAFCNSPLAPAPTETIVPAQGVLPFQVTKETAGEKFRDWLRGLWFRPSNLKALGRLEELRGVYVPFWSFDASAFSRWSAEAGFYYYVEETYVENGQQKTRRVQKTRWEPASGTHAGNYADLLVHASAGLPVKEMGHLEPYQIDGKLTVFDTDFLAGFEAEAHSLGARECWKEASDRIGAKERSACSALVPGDTQRDLRVATETSNEQARSLLLPVYLGVYEYRGRPFRIAVNGQTGLVSGAAPWSAWKIVSFVLVLAGVAAAIWYFAQRGTPPGR
jgi:DNA-directed RNA polymerase subunit RPC12/RpoP